ncbi:serine hydrolase FSH [Aspergillus pseudoustus]|uniref:Serine hydrolase FSH n=1 Tax=Aspergillus pseudoustus TaxID=1810923 RepID=A0ABR4K695_9EURO
MSTVTPLSDPSLHLPRILCLHGGGANARIFQAQCRVLRKALKGTFRLCFADAPFPSEPGPDITSVYQDRGPFQRWLRFKREHPALDADVAVATIDSALKTAMRADDDRGATGEWVGLLGFSQGAKMAASLLFRQQVQDEKLTPGQRPGPGPVFRFAVLLAGRGPLVSLAPGLVMTPSLVDASHLGFQVKVDRSRSEHVLRLPTIHVHGSRDGGLPLHRVLLEEYCDTSRVRLIQWDGGHRVPIESKVVGAIAHAMVDVARETGILK